MHLHQRRKEIKKVYIQNLSNKEHTAKVQVKTEVKLGNLR